MKLIASDLIVGTTSGYAPYVSLDAQGNYEGFDIDLAELLAKKLNKKLVIKDLGSMPSLMLALKQKKIDALIWAISITEDRLKNYEMVYYQGDKTTEMPFLFWDKIPERITTIADLAKEKTICVEAGSYQEGILKKFSEIKIKNVDRVTDAIMEIKFGKSLATTIDHSLVSRFQTQYPEIKVLNLPLPSSAQSLGNGICINKANQELAAQVRKVVDELRAEGKVAELEKKWKLR
jgi:polar amino acid transport system substrate-binding protein